MVVTARGLLGSRFLSPFGWFVDFLFIFKVFKLEAKAATSFGSRPLQMLFIDNSLLLSFQTIDHLVFLVKLRMRLLIRRACLL